jgi:arginine N-succinyltransferase
MLPETARSAIGLPHPSGRAAMRMLEAEGFAYEGYVDIFDGGPTMTARTDKVESIGQAKSRTVMRTGDPGAGKRRVLAATGALADFRCTFAELAEDGHGVALDGVAAAALDVGAGDTVWFVDR